jgi:hypothetical protein
MLLDFLVVRQRGSSRIVAVGGRVEAPLHKSVEQVLQAFDGGRLSRRALYFCKAVDVTSQR